MSETILLALAAIVALGIGAQWVAWRFHLPAILLLLIAGVIAGPDVTGWVRPNLLFGDVLLPVVSASVAIILFEGGLTLNLRELRATGSVLWRLVTLGAAVTWAAGTVAAHWIVGLDLDLSLLIGAVLVVSGPTVIGPLLRTVRPRGRAGTILRWEGILIDPIGAVLAVLVFEAIQLERTADLPTAITQGVLRTAGVGIGVGVFAAAVLVLVIKRYLIPDFLHNSVSLAVVLGAFVAANQWVSEGGLVAVTVMGMALANQRIASVRHIIEFKETLRVLLISGLFIVLAAGIRVDAIRELGWRGLAFLAAILGVRPVAVWLSTAGSSLPGRERVFLSVVAPRGIVAAAISSVFALEISPFAYPQSRLIAPLAFLVIVGSILISGVAAPRAARALGLSDPSPQGVLIVGANPVARALSAALVEEELPVILVDNDPGNKSAAQMQGLRVELRSILSEEVSNQFDLSGIGRLFALTPNDHLNALAVQHLVHLFGRAAVYQLPPKGERERERAVATHQHGRLLFGADVGYATLADRLARGATIKHTPLSEQFTFEDYVERYGDGALPLFVVTAAGKLSVFAVDGKPTPKAGDKLISLVDAGAGEDVTRAARAEAPA